LVYYLVRNYCPKFKRRLFFPRFDIDNCTRGDLRSSLSNDVHEIHNIWQI